MYKSVAKVKRISCALTIALLTQSALPGWAFSAEPDLFTGNDSNRALFGSQEDLEAREAAAQSLIDTLDALNSDMNTADDDDDAADDAPEPKFAPLGYHPTGATYVTSEVIDTGITRIRTVESGTDIILRTDYDYDSTSRYEWYSWVNEDPLADYVSSEDHTTGLTTYCDGSVSGTGYDRRITNPDGSYREGSGPYTYYDREGRITEIVGQNTYGDWSVRTQFLYDAAGREIYATHEDAEGESWTRRTEDGIQTTDGYSSVTGYAWRQVIDLNRGGRVVEESWSYAADCAAANCGYDDGVGGQVISHSFRSIGTGGDYEETTTYRYEGTLTRRIENGILTESVVFGEWDRRDFSLNFDFYGDESIDMDMSVAYEGGLSGRQTRTDLATGQIIFISESDPYRTAEWSWLEGAEGSALGLTTLRVADKTGYWDDRTGAHWVQYSDGSAKHYGSDPSAGPWSIDLGNTRLLSVESGDPEDYTVYDGQNRIVETRRGGLRMFFDVSSGRLTDLWERTGTVGAPGDWTPVTYGPLEGLEEIFSAHDYRFGAPHHPWTLDRGDRTDTDRRALSDLMTLAAEEYGVSRQQLRAESFERTNAEGRVRYGLKARLPDGSARYLSFDGLTRTLLRLLPPPAAAQNGVDVNILDWQMTQAADYAVYRRIVGETAWQNIAVVHQGSRHIDQMIDPNRSYQYEIRPVEAGNIELPPIPVNLSANYERAYQGLRPENVLALVNLNDMGLVDIGTEVEEYALAHGALDPLDESDLRGWLGLAATDALWGSADTNGDRTNTAWGLKKDAQNRIWAPLGVYYAMRRGIPKENVVFLSNIPVEERARMGLGEFDVKVLQPILQHMRSRDILDRITSVVSVFRFPIVATSQVYSYVGYSSSWEYALSDGLRRALPVGGSQNMTQKPGRPVSRQLGDTYFVATRVDAQDLTTSRRMIDDAIWAEENYMFEDSDWIREESDLRAFFDYQGAYASYDPEFRIAANLAYESGYFTKPGDAPCDPLSVTECSLTNFGVNSDFWNTYVSSHPEYDLDQDGRLDQTFLRVGWYDYFNYQDYYDMARGAIAWNLDSASGVSYRQEVDRFGFPELTPADIPASMDAAELWRISYQVLMTLPGQPVDRPDVDPLTKLNDMLKDPTLIDRWIASLIRTDPGRVAQITSDPILRNQIQQTDSLRHLPFDQMSVVEQETIIALNRILIFGKELGQWWTPLLLNAPGDGELLQHRVWGAGFINDFYSLDGSLLKRGATVTLGAVDEPLLSGHTNPRLFTDYLIKGFSFGEVASASDQNNNYTQMSYNGDPLYRPFAAKFGTGNVLALSSGHVRVLLSDANANGSGEAYRDYDDRGRLTAERLADGTQIVYMPDGRTVISKSIPGTQEKMITIFEADGRLSAKITVPSAGDDFERDEIVRQADGSVRIRRLYKNSTRVDIFNQDGALLDLDPVTGGIRTAFLVRTSLSYVSGTTKSTTSYQVIGSTTYQPMTVAGVTRSVIMRITKTGGATMDFSYEPGTFEIAGANYSSGGQVQAAVTRDLAGTNFKIRLTVSGLEWEAPVSTSVSALYSSIESTLPLVYQYTRYRNSLISYLQLKHGLTSAQAQEELGYSVVPADLTSGRLKVPAIQGHSSETFEFTDNGNRATTGGGTVIIWVKDSWTGQQRVVSETFADGSKREYTYRENGTACAYLETDRSGVKTGRDMNGRIVSMTVNGVQEVYVGYPDKGFASVTDALQFAPSGSVVRIAKGVYRETVNARIWKNLTVVGDGTAEEVVIEGAPGVAGFARIESGTVTFQDLTFRNFKVAGEHGITIIGGGVLRVVGTGVTLNLNRTVFDGNSAETGGAVYLSGDYASLNVTDSIFRNNYESGTNGKEGGAISANGIVRITGSVFENNNGNGWGGGALKLSYTGYINANTTPQINARLAEGKYYALIEDTLFSGNSAGRLSYTEGGAIVIESPEAVIRRSVFDGNRAGFAGGAIVAAGGKLLIEDSLFMGNAASNGAAIYARWARDRYGRSYGASASVTVTGSTFTGNLTSMSGAGTLWLAPDLPSGAAGARLTMARSIFHGNVGSSVFGADAALSLTDVLLQDLRPGSGVLTGDPLFIDAAGLDYRIRPDSVAQSAGDPPVAWGSEGFGPATLILNEGFDPAAPILNEELGPDPMTPAPSEITDPYFGYRFTEQDLLIGDFDAEEWIKSVYEKRRKRFLVIHTN